MARAGESGTPYGSALGERAREMHRQLTAYALRRGLSPDDAEDISQVVMLRLWERFRDVPESKQAVYLVARREISNFWRGSHRRLALTAKLARYHPREASDTVTSPETTDIGAALARLTPVARDALLLACDGALTHQQAASKIGLSPAAYSLRLHRARRSLRQLVPTRSGTQHAV